MAYFTNYKIYHNLSFIIMNLTINKNCSCEFPLLKTSHQYVYTATVGVLCGVLITCRCKSWSLRQNTVHYTGRWQSPTPPSTVEKWILFTLPIPNPDISFIGLYLLKVWGRGYLWNFMDNLNTILSWERGANPDSLIICYSLTQLDSTHANYFNLYLLFTITWRVPRISFSLKHFITNRIIVSKYYYV